MYYVYILANKQNGTLYTGVTNNIHRRIYEHKKDIFTGFTKKYHIHKLVYVESTRDIRAAIYREKCIKKWKRQWKIELIQTINPSWKDLYYNVF